MCLILPISKKKCVTGRAGIRCLWLIGCESVIDITFDEDRAITGIEIDCSQIGRWTKIEFEKDTAFFNQEKTRVKNSIVVSQTISFIEPVMTPELRKAMKLINACCCLHAVVLDNTGRYHYAGITDFEDLGEWVSDDLKTGDGSGNTGADSTADSNEYIETITATTGYYAPFLVNSPENITNSCGIATPIGSPNENTAWGNVSTGEVWEFGNQNQ